MNDKSKAGYAGAGWLLQNFKYSNPDKVVSEFGCEVANLLGDLFAGIYHMDAGALERTDWSCTWRISVTVRDNGQFGTHDFNSLTRLVFLAHEQGIKATIEAASSRYLRLTFHKVGAKFCPPVHPTIEQALNRFMEVQQGGDK